MGFCSTECTTHGFVFCSWFHPQMLVVTFLRSPYIFSLIENKISYKHDAHENHLFLIAEKYAEQERQVFTLKDTAQ